MGILQNKCNKNKMKQKRIREYTTKVKMGNHRRRISSKVVKTCCLRRKIRKQLLFPQF